MFINKVICKKYTIPDIVHILSIDVDIVMPAQTTNSKHIIGILLDKSGSMSGTVMKNTQKAAINLVEQLYGTHDFFIVAYAGYKSKFVPNPRVLNEYTNVKTNKKECDVYNMIGEDKHTIISTINNIKAGGRTCFKLAFDAANKIIVGLKDNPRVSIIFFTDGYDTDSESVTEINTSLQKLVSSLNTYTTNPQIHCLGFGDHDSRFLNKVANIYHSSYQYIMDSVDIYKKMASLIPLVSTDCSIEKIYLDDKKFTVILNDIKGDTSNWKNTQLYIPINTTIKSKYKFTIKNTNIHDILLSVSNEETLVGKLKYIYKYVVHYIKIYIEDDKNVDSKIVIIKKIDEFIDQLWRNKTIISEDARNMYIDTKLLISDFISLVCQNLKNEQVRLYELIYLTKFEKTLSKNGTKNLAKFTLYKNKIKENSVTISSDKTIYPVDTKHPMFLSSASLEHCSNEPTCDITKKCLSELIKDGDCLSICLNVTKSFSGITKINKIFGIYTGTKIFHDRYIVAARLNKKHPDTIITIKNKKINAILPLYISKEHWDIAKYWLPMTLGLITYHEPLEYTEEQTISFPFLVLEKAITSRYDKKIIDMILITCQWIYKIASYKGHKLSDETKKKYQTYVSDPYVSMDIYSNKLFLAHIYVAMSLGDIEMKNQTEFVKIMCLEEARRRLKANTIAIPNNLMLNLLNVDVKHWIVSYVENYDKKIKNGRYLIKKLEKQYRADINTQLCLLSKKKMTENISETDDVFEIDTINEQYDPKNWKPNNTLSMNAKKLLQKIISNYNKYGKPELELISTITNNIYPDLKNLYTPERKLAFAIQTYIYHNKENKINDIKSGVYIDPTDQKQAEAYLKEIFIRCITEERKKLISTNSIDTMDIRMKIFANTNDLIVAAGALNGAYIGVNIKKYVKYLLEKKCPLGIEKFKMMIYGKYKDIKLIMDIDNAPNKCWLPSKKICHKLFRIYNMDMEPNQWYMLFDTINARHNLQNWYNDIFTWNKKQHKISSKKKEENTSTSNISFHYIY